MNLLLLPWYSKHSNAFFSLKMSFVESFFTANIVFKSAVWFSCLSVFLIVYAYHVSSIRFEFHIEIDLIFNSLRSD
jgi:hypothetical protein